jgi:hypothetical protein
LDPRRLTTGDATREKRVKDEYKMAREMVPMSPS